MKELVLNQPEEMFALYIEHFNKDVTYDCYCKHKKYIRHLSDLLGVSITAKWI